MRNLQERAKLKATLRELHAISDEFQPSLFHRISDYALLHFVHDAREQVGAASLIAENAAPRAALPNTRAALETVLDMYVLVADSSTYDEQGAFVRVTELLANEANRKHVATASTVLGAAQAVPSRSPEDIVEQEALEWEADHPGIAVTFRRALGQAREEKRWRYHWSGIRRFSDRAEHVEHKHGAPLGFKELITAWYRMLTRASHPGFRTSSRALIRDTAGRITFHAKAGSERLPLAAAQFACEHAIHAMQVRRASRWRGPRA